MSDLADEIAQVISETSVTRHGFLAMNTAQAKRTAQAIIDALPGLVKPLVWMRAEKKTAFSKRRHIAPGYIIEERLHGDHFDLWVGVNAASATRYPALEAAKAAAQADYTRRILAALGVTP